LGSLGVAAGLLLLSFGGGLVCESFADTAVAAALLLTGASFLAAGLLLIFLTLKRWLFRPRTASENRAGIFGEHNAPPAMYKPLQADVSRPGLVQNERIGTDHGHIEQQWMERDTENRSSA